MTPAEWEVIGFTVRMALLSTVLILPFALAAAYLLARFQWPGKSIIETLIALPLVLPPVATGLFLLKLFGRRGPAGPMMERLGLDVVFTWRAVLLAMAVMSFPLLARTARAAFEQVNPRFEQIAATLGAGRFRVFCSITLPLAMRWILGGLILAFARGLGEFGATIMVAGNIPGRTTTLSLSIYQSVQLGEDSAAMRLIGVSVVLAFAAIWVSEVLIRRQAKA